MKKSHTRISAALATASAAALMSLPLGTAAQTQATQTPSNQELSFVPSPYVDFDGYLQLSQEVQPYRQQRLVSLDRFMELAGQPGVIILDARSRQMYALKHVRGAVNLPFSDFTQSRLEGIIPSTDTTILIYCNNNFIDDQEAFPTKMYTPPSNLAGQALPNTRFGATPSLSLALNIPTYINLYGYGYRNVYELGELISVNDPRIAFDGSFQNSPVRPSGPIGVVENP